MATADEPLATLEDLRLRLDFALDADEERVGRAALEDLSNEARALGSPSWSTPNSTPSYVRTLILKAASRYLKNVEGYVQSRAGDESVQWAEIPGIMGTASFTADEERKIASQARPSALINSNTYAYSNRRAGYGFVEYMVPVHGGGQWFPFLDDRDLRRMAHRP